MKVITFLLGLSLLIMAACSNEEKESEASLPEPPDMIILAMDGDSSIINPMDIKSFNRMMYANLVYPDAALKADVGGEVPVSFVVTPEGRIGKIEFLGDSLGHGIEQEVYRVLMLSDGHWQPKNSAAENHKVELRTKFTFTVY